MSPQRRAHRWFGIAAYGIAMASLAAFMGVVVALGLDWLPPRPTAELPWPWIVNALWLVIFGLQHSVMARPWFKAWLTHSFPPHLHRSLYVACSGLALLGLTLTWQPLPGSPLWHDLYGLWAISALGALGTLGCSLYFAHFDFFGLSQSWFGHEPPDATLVIRGPYRFVRHPLMISALMFLWGQPTMPMTLFVLTGGLTLYIVLALPWEERDLTRRFGAAYEDYRRRVPMLIPRLQPVPAQTIQVTPNR